MVQFLWICLGGAAGSGARYLVSGWVASAFGASFPYGTLTVNVAGSFLLGFMLEAGLTTTWLSPTARIALTTGVMGGFTTYSTFNYETLTAFESGSWPVALANILVTVTVCLAAGWLGISSIRLILAR